jgi:hypothetical protein
MEQSYGRRVEEGTLLTYLPRELRSEVYRFRYRCDFTVRLTPLPEAGFILELIDNDGLRLSFPISLAFIRSKKGARTRMRQFLTSLMPDQIGGVRMFFNENLAMVGIYGTTELLIDTAGVGSIVLPICTQIVEALEEIERNI